MNNNDHLVETLTNSSLYDGYARAFTEATGMPIALRPVETWKLPLHGKRKENPFCALMAGSSRSCAACLQTQAKLAEDAIEEPCAVTCPYGLTEMAVPVRLGQKTLGFLQTGQVFRHKPAASGFEKVVGQMEKLNPGVDKGELERTYYATQVVPQAKMDAASKLLSIFADHLSMKGNQIAVQQSNAEPPVIGRAKKFIMDNITEELSLGKVAAAVHTSSFYFCKLFKKVTGINFTQFVSRARTEKAKNLLLNRNLRVSEIAYEVGFQSLTHFNRTFKAFVGESPTEYRLHLTAAA